MASARISQRPTSAPNGAAPHSARGPARRAARAEESDEEEFLVPQSSPSKRRVKFVEGASNFVPRGSAQAAARFARQPCQRLHVATTLRRGERLSPRAPKFYRPSSAQVNFRRTPVGNLQIVYPPTPEVLTLARKFTEEEEVEAEVSPELQAISQEEAQEVSPKETASPGAGGVLDLQDHLRDIWLMYHPQEDTEEADEKDKALLLALHGPDEEDKEEALLNEMKLLKTGEDAIAFFAKHGDQSDLQVIYCVAAEVEEGKFRPYDLVVVDDKDKGSEYFMISPKGIVKISPGKQSEHTTLTSWMHQVMIYTVLVSMSFFRNYLTGRAFRRWSSGASNQVFAKHRRTLSQRLFLAKPIFVEAKVKMHGILRNLSFAGLLALDGQRSAVELRPLLAQQRGLCEGADLDSTAEAAREVLDETIKKLMSGQDHVTPQARLLKMMHRGRNVSVFAERQAAEREAYLERLCEFNRSLIGNFIRMIDVIQQSCLVDLAVSKVRSLYDRFARTPKLFQVSAAFEPAPGAKVPLVLEPGKQDFLEGMQQVLEQITAAVSQVSPVVSYRKYSRHFKADPLAANPTDVIWCDGTFRSAKEGLMKQIETDFDKAQQFCEGHFAVVHKIHLHSLDWDAEAFERAHHTHETLAQGMGEMQVFDRHLDKLKTNHPIGFLAIEARSLKAALVPHVETSLQAMKSQLRALAARSCKQAAERYYEVNHKLQERPKSLDPLVEYVRSFKRIEKDVATLEALKTTVEEMYATLFQNNIRIDMAEDMARDMMTQRAATFEHTALPGAQFFVAEQGESACLEVDHRFAQAEQDAEDLQDEIAAGMAADPAFLPEANRVVEYLDEVGGKLDEFAKTFQYLNDCYVLFMQEPHKLAILEEAREVWQKRYHLWAIAAQWLETTASVATEPLLTLDVSRVKCQLQGFLEILARQATEMPHDGVILELQDTIDAWLQQRVPVLAQVAGPAMGPRQWTQVLGAFADANELKVSHLEFMLSGPAAEKAQKNLRQAAAKANAEHALLSTVCCIKEAWEFVEMRLQEPEDSESPHLLDRQDELLDLLHEDTTALEVVLQSPDCPEEASELRLKLSRGAGMLQELLDIQERYSVLEPLFRMKVLDETEVGDRAVEKFGACDEAWRLLMHRAQTTCKTVMLFTCQSTLAKQLQRMWEGVQAAEEASSRILEERRRQAPRLWFLSDSRLTRALSASQKSQRGRVEKPLAGLQQALDAAAGKALEDLGDAVFPWATEAHASVGPLDKGVDPTAEARARREVRRRSSAGEILREEMDQAIKNKADSDLPPLNLPKKNGERQEETRTAEDLKSALLGPSEAKPRPKPLLGSMPRSLSTVVDDMLLDEDGPQLDEECGSPALWRRCLALGSCGETFDLSFAAHGGPRGCLLASWTSAAVKAMQGCLRVQIKEALKKVVADALETIMEWGAGVETWCSQALLVALQVYFRHIMEVSMGDGGGGLASPLPAVEERLQSLQKLLPRLLRSGLGQSRRCGLGAMVVQASYWQDQLETLKEKLGRLDSFRWKRFLHPRWIPASSEISLTCLDWSMAYGYEYVGAQPGLVRSPQSEKCFLSLAAALRASSNAAALGISGPAACGKSQLIHDLARAAAVPLVRAAPSLGLLGLQQFLAGIATTNAWGRCCELDTAPSEALPLLAVLGTALRDLLLAARTRKELQLGPFQVRCTAAPKAVFVQLPAGENQRRLPVGLTATLRPVAVSRPPARRVVALLLQVEGFEPEAAERLAVRLTEAGEAGAAEPAAQIGLRRLRLAVKAAGSALQRDAPTTEVLNAAFAALGGTVPAVSVVSASPSGLHLDEESLARSFTERVAGFCADAGLSLGVAPEEADPAADPAAFGEVAAEVFQHLRNGRAPVLMGPACCGKSTLLQALQASAHTPELSLFVLPGGVAASQELRTWVVYPQALVDEYGGRERLQGILWKLLESIKPKEESALSGVRDLIVFDGEVNGTWADLLWPLLRSRHLVQPGGFQSLSDSTQLLFETRSLEGASPSFCATCALCTLEGALSARDLLEAFRGRVESGLAGRTARMHAPVLTAWLERLSEDLKGAQDLLPGFDEMVATDQLLRLLEDSWRTALPMMDDLEEEDIDPTEQELLLLEVWTIYCTAWVLGGGLSVRKRLGIWLLSSLEGENGLPRGLFALGSEVLSDPENLWKFRVLNTGLGAGEESATCVKLVSELLPEPEEIPHHALFVPAEETEAITLFVSHQVHVRSRLGFRLSGQRQCGKSALAEQLVRTSKMLGCGGELLRCPHRLSAASFVTFVRERLPRRGAKLLSPMPGSQMCLVVDDLHLASPAVAEEMRQVADRGSIDAGGAWQAQGLWFGAVSPAGGSERWARHFVALHFPELSERSLRELGTRLINQWSVQVPSEDARMLLLQPSFPDKIVRAILEVGSRCGASLQLPVLHLVRWLRTVGSGACFVKSCATLQRLVWHEGMRQLGDRLAREDRGSLRSIFEYCGMFLPSGDEAQPLFADTGDYMEFTDMQHAQQSLGRLLDGVSNTFDMPLVFFEDMTISVLGALRAMQCATPWEPGGVLLLGPVGSGRKTCAAAASALASSSLQRPRSVDLAGLRNEIRQFSATDSLGRGLQSFGPITEDWLLLEGGDMVLEDIDDIIRGATRIEVQKTVHALLRTKSRAESDQDDPPRRTLKGSETSKYQGAARLAFVLCFSPSLAPEWFRQQLARFSCLSSMGVVWLQPWRHNAFLEVGKAVLSFDAGLDSASLDYDAKEQRIASMSSAAAEMMEMQRAGAQTPGGGAHFISAVTTVREMLSAKEAELNKESKSLDRVADALAQMAKHLEVFQAKHGNAWREVQDCEQMVKEMEKQLEQKLQDAEEAKAHGEILSQQEEEVKLQVSKCSIVVHDATADVNQEMAMAGLQLRALPASAIEECQTARYPSQCLERATFTTLAALGIQESWANVVTLISDKEFITRLEEIDLAGKPQRAALVQERLEQLEALGGLSEEPGSALGAALQSWAEAFVAAVKTWNSVQEDVAALRKVEEAHHQKLEELDEANEALDSLEDQIMELKMQMQSRRSDAVKARTSIHHSDAEVMGLKSLQELIDSQEALAWRNRRAELGAAFAELPGRLLLGSFLAHYGTVDQEALLGSWRTVCQQYELLSESSETAEQLLRMMADACGVKDLDAPSFLGQLPPQLAAAAFCGQTAPRICDPFGVARHWLEKRLAAMTGSLCSEITLTSTLGCSPLDELKASMKNKRTSLLIALGEEFGGPLLPPGLHSWLSQKDFGPGTLFLLSSGQPSQNTAGFVLDFGTEEALRQFLLAEAIFVASPTLHHAVADAYNQKLSAQATEHQVQDEILATCGDGKKRELMADITLAQKVLEMMLRAAKHREEQKAAEQAIVEAQSVSDLWQRLVNTALAVIRVACSVETWHPLYRGEVMRCMDWLWRYLDETKGRDVTQLSADLPSAWLEATAHRVFPRHHPSLFCCLALALETGAASARTLVSALRDAASDLQGEWAARTSAPSEVAAFVSPQGWERFLALDQFPELAQVTKSLLAEPGRWQEALKSSKELPISLGLKELLVVAALAPQALPQKLLRFSLKKLEAEGEMFPEGPAALVNRAVQEAGESHRAPAVLFFTQAACRAAQSTLQRLAAQEQAPFEVISLLDPSCTSKVAAAHARFSERHSGWLLLSDAELLERQLPKHPQLMKRLRSLMDLARAAKLRKNGAPPVLLAAQLRADSDSSFGWAHLLEAEPVRAFLSWPVGLQANFRALKEEMSCELEGWQRDFCVLHALRSAGGGQGDWTWHPEEPSPTSADLLGSWPANWAQLLPALPSLSHASGEVPDAELREAMLQVLQQVPHAQDELYGLCADSDVEERCTPVPLLQEVADGMTAWRFG